MSSSTLHSKSYDAVQNIGDNLGSTKRSVQNIFKNLAVLCTSTLLLFTAYDALTMLQSTMNRKGGIGVISQATMFACFSVSAMLLPKLIISKFGSKRIVVLCMFAKVPYIASNYYPHWSLMITSSIIGGLAGPCLWASYGVYLNALSLLYSDHLESKNEEPNEKSKLIKDKSIVVYDKILKPEYQVSNGTKDSEQRYFQIEDTPTLTSSEYIKETHGNEFPKPFQGSKTNLFSNSSEETRGKIKKGKEIEQKFSKNNISPIAKENNYQKPTRNTCATNTEGNKSKVLVLSKTIFLLSSVTANFFGIHGMAHLTSHIWSSLLSYFILKTDITSETFRNSTCYCGADFCNVASDCFENNAGGPSINTRYLLTTICVCVALFSIIIAAVFLDPLKQDREYYFSFNNIKATYNILKKKEMLLLIPLSIHSGLIQGFYVGDFNKSYVACAWGTYHVGLVALCYGVMCGVSSLLSGWLVRHVGRRIIFTTAAVVNAVSIAYLLVWTPNSKSPEMFFIASGLWGTQVGIIWSQLRALYGVFFKSDEEAAFSAFHMWSSLGTCLAFAYSNFFCTSLKIYVMLAISVLGFTGYFIAEVINNKKMKT
ncbi:UNC93-like protein [Nephila pilipes]|uniref:UNC93-like protein n=1 Tax=Nephila pilipes TaxID=299642 RepID=A0A8X6U3S7_NEPPI|nr:UNC93-like protein [Nephila pilipes]